MPIVSTGADHDVGRRQMPQIPQEQLAEYMRWLRLNDVQATVSTVPAKLLHPVQDHVDQQKVERMQEDLDTIRKQFIVVSDGYYIIDGHHRWYVLHEADPGTPVRIVHVHLPVNDAVKLSNEFEGSYNAGIHEVLKLADLLKDR